MKAKCYQDLIVWQKSMELVKSVYELVQLLPREETFALSNQMRRAAISIPSNIAEGYARASDKELNRFLHISRGSIAELETQILLAAKLNYVSGKKIEHLLNMCNEVGRQLNAFIAVVNKDLEKSNKD